MRVQIGDGRLFVDVDGVKLAPDGPWMRERPTVVLVHPGPGFDHALFKLQVGPWLARDAQVVYVDLRGHGRSDPAPLERLTLDTWADDLGALCDALEIERPTVMAYGFGTMVALRHAVRSAAPPSRLVLVNPAARLVAARSVTVFDRLGGAAAGEAARAFYEDPGHHTFADFVRLCFPLLTRRDDVAAEFTARAQWTLDVLVHWYRGEARTVDLRAEIARVDLPTYVLAAENDPITTFAAAEELVAALPAGSVRFRRVPGAAHGVFLDAPEEFDAVRAFILEADEG